MSEGQTRELIRELVWEWDPLGDDDATDPIFRGTNTTGSFVRSKPSSGWLPMLRPSRRRWRMLFADATEWTILLRPTRSHAAWSY